MLIIILLSSSKKAFTYFFILLNYFSLLKMTSSSSTSSNDNLFSFENFQNVLNENVFFNVITAKKKDPLDWGPPIIHDFPKQIEKIDFKFIEKYILTLMNYQKNGKRDTESYDGLLKDNPGNNVHQEVTAMKNFLQLISNYRYTDNKDNKRYYGSRSFWFGPLNENRLHYPTLQKGIIGTKEQFEHEVYKEFRKIIHNLFPYIYWHNTEMLAVSKEGYLFAKVFLLTEEIDFNISDDEDDSLEYYKN